MQGELELFEKKQAIFTFDEDRKSPAKIVVIGIGGAGGNSVDRMVAAGIKGVELVAADTDLQALQSLRAPVKLEMGMSVTKGLSCGGHSQLGQQAALDETERILGLLEGSDMVFLIGGEGGGTFTGAAPIFAGLASETGALTIAMVTMPFSFQGMKRLECAEAGVQELMDAADAMIIVPNENLLRALDEDVLLEDSFRIADDFLCQAVQGISEIIAKPEIMNLDLAAVRTLMQHKGLILIGTGIADGSNRAAEAVQRAISSPLLEGMPIAGAKAALVNIAGSRCSLKLHEVKSAAKIIKEKTGLEDMMVAAMYDDGLGNSLKVTVIATGIRQDKSQQTEDSRGVPESGAEIVALKPGVLSGSPCSSHQESHWEHLDQPSFRRRRAG